MAEDQDPADTGTAAPPGTRSKDRNQRIREEAAQKRKGRGSHEQRRANVQRNLAPGEMVDDALARGTHAATGWLKRHLNVIQWVIVAVVAGGFGWKIYNARHHKTDAVATATLMAGITAEFARVGDSDEVEADAQTGLADTRPHYPDDAARLKAAQDAYRAAGGTETIHSLAQLGLAGVLYDGAKYKEALAAYQGVQQSALAKQDTDVRLRSLEGVGLSHEGLGEKDAARKAFHELGNSDVTLFSALGLYHEGRLAFAAGERDSAKDLLKKALDKVSKQENADSPPGFMSQAARELLAAIDPSAVPPAPSKGGLTPAQLQQLSKSAEDKGGGGTGLSKEKLEELMRQLRQQQPQPAPSGAPAGKP